MRISDLDTSAAPIADAFVERFVIEPSSAGPLGGMAFAVKDLFDVAGHFTGCGNPDWRATHPVATATAVVPQRLLAAGARLVGKTRTDEMAYSLDGRNHHEGAPLNPAAPARLTGGSSSGAASAVAAGAVDFAIATDTAGSVRVPAAWCGLIGLRPTHARISSVGLAPLAPSFDTVGWLARSGALMCRIGTVLFTDAAADASPRDWVRDPAIDARCDAGTSGDNGPALRFAARHAMHPVNLGLDLEAVAQCLRVLQGAEVWATHGPWIEAVRPRFGPGVAERFEAARSITAEQVHSARRDRDVILEKVDALLPPGRVLCLPTVPGPAARRDASADVLQAQRARLFPLTALASLTGRPQISLPLRCVGGAPVGLSLLGWRHGDEALLRIAAEALP